MRIRDADPAADAAACAAIYAPFVQDTVVSFEQVPPSEEDFAQRIERVMDTHPWLVAEDGELIGFTYATQHRERAAYRWATDVTIYVDSSHRRRGAGRLLYQTLFDLLRKQGLRTACAGITLPNDASVGLHHALGFKPVGVYRRIGWKAGAWWDVGWWQLELGDDSPPMEPGPPLRLS